MRRTPLVSELSGQLFSASVSAALDDVAAVFGAHSLTETVNLTSVSFFGLIRS